MSDDVPSGMDKVISTVLRQSGYGSDNTSLSDLLRGPSTSGLGNLTQANQDSQGWTFFTKPCCNLHPDNIDGVRKLAYLADEDPRSIGKAIKALLTTRKFNLRNGDIATPSELVDEDQAFNYLMSGTLKSLTGFPDHVATFFSSDEGVAKESYGWIDSRHEFYGEFSLNATFQNIEGDLLTSYLSALHQYQSNVAYGSMMPWNEFRAMNAVDYQFRIYRLVVDKTKENILKIASTGPCMIETPADGAAFNYASENVMAADNAEISIPIKVTTGVRYNDPKIVDDFNRTVAFYNIDMTGVILEEARKIQRMPFEVSTMAATSMVKIHRDEYKLCSNSVYPYIHDDGKGAKLEWWIRAEDLNSLLTNF